MDAPHTGVTHLPCGGPGGSFNGGKVAELGHDTMRWHFSMGVAGRGNLKLGPHHQWVDELAGTGHALGRNGTGVRGHKIHQSKTDGLHARVRRNVKSPVNSGG